MLCKEASIQEKVRAATKERKKSRLARSVRSEVYGERSSVHHSHNRSASEKTSTHDKIMLCLNPQCRQKGTKHKGGVRNCPFTPKEKAIELIREMMSDKRKKGQRKLKGRRSLLRRILIKWVSNTLVLSPHSFVSTEAQI